MRCPMCHSKTQVLDSRPVPNGVWRRRQCTSCKHRFGTREVESVVKTPKRGPFATAFLALSDVNKKIIQQTVMDMYDDANRL